MTVTAKEIAAFHKHEAQKHLDAAALLAGDASITAPGWHLEQCLKREREARDIAAFHTAAAAYVLSK